MSNVTPPQPNPERSPEQAGAQDAGSVHATSADSSHTDGTQAPPVQLYWRPGCGFCSSLTRSLDRIGLDYDRHNIWDDEDAAVFVRGVADGNETVPTVRVGDVALINPTAQEVMAEVATRAPARLPADYRPPEPSALGRALRRMLGG